MNNSINIIVETNFTCSSGIIITVKKRFRRQKLVVFSLIHDASASFIAGYFVFLLVCNFSASLLSDTGTPYGFVSANHNTIIGYNIATRESDMCYTVFANKHTIPN